MRSRHGDTEAYPLWLSAANTGTDIPARAATFASQASAELAASLATIDPTWVKWGWRFQPEALQ